MAILAGMDTLKFTAKTLVRHDPEVTKAFKMAVLALSTSKAARFTGKKVAMENATAALWHWFSQLDEAAAEAFLVEQFPRLEAFMREHPSAPEGEAEAADDPTPPATRSTPKIAEHTKKGKSQGA